MRPPTSQFNLPAPTAEELAHSAQLMAVMRAEIEQTGGAIAFARFMELALYAPGLGYYSAGKTKFGAAGDFVTAPELGNVFARTCAHALAPTVRALRANALASAHAFAHACARAPTHEDARKNEPVVWLELGGGSGAFAADVLQALESLDALPDHYWILERSADLRERQAQRIEAQVPHLMSRVAWLDAPPDQPWRGVLFANEVVDALAVERFALSHGALHRQGVRNFGDGGFAWCELPADAAFKQRVGTLLSPEVLSAHPHYESEFIADLGAWMQSLTNHLRAGLVLMIDYGYPRSEFYLPERREGTLVCHYHHRAHSDPLQLVGLQDITAFVDFTALAEAGVDCGLQLAGYVSQSNFLLGSGIESVMQGAMALPDLERLAITRQIKKLMLPGEMGERFQAMVFARGDVPIPAACKAFDRSDRLGMPV